MTIQPVDLALELYLAPEATGVYDWVSFTPLAAPHECSVRRGVDDLNSEPAPGWMKCVVRDPSGNLNPQNPTGLYFGHIGLGTQFRCSFKSTEDSFTRTETNTWGAVGNAAGDTWTNGSSSGGVIAATDWTVSGGTARHSVPATSAYRVSELSKTTRVLADAEVRFTVTCPTSNVTGTGALASEVWFRTENVLNYVAAALAFLPDDTLSVAFYDRTAGVNRYLMNYTTIPDLNLASGTVYDVAFQIEGSTMRAKVWESGDPEPMDWQLFANGADVRSGYVAVASFVYAGNTNALPLVFQYDNFKLRMPVFAGEITGLKPEGEDASSGAKVVKLTAHDILNRIKLPSEVKRSTMRRSRTSPRKWLFTGSPVVVSGTTNTFTILTASVGRVLVGDFFFAGVNAATLAERRMKEDTQFRITGSSVAGANTTFTFSPDARDALEAGNLLSVYREGAFDVQPIAYWPMEDGEQSTQISAGIDNCPPMSIVGSPDFASDSTIATSKPLLRLNGAELTSIIPPYTATSAITISFVLSMPDTDEAATGTDILQFYTTGTGYSYDLRYTASGDGSLQLLVSNNNGTLLYDSGDVSFSMRGGYGEIALALEQVGGTVTYRLQKTNVTTSGGGVGPLTITGVTTLGRVTQVRVNPAGGYTNVTTGHLTVVPDLWTFDTTRFDLPGWPNQPAMRRILRICYEENIPFCYKDNPDVTTQNIGQQKEYATFDLIKQVPEMGGGFLVGAKGAVALEWTTRGAMYNQDPVFTLHGGAGGHIGRPLEPVFDYAESYNYVSVDRADGGTVVVEETEGPLSTQLPPSGISRREREFSLSAGDDLVASRIAEFNLAVGVLLDPRIAEVSTNPAARNSITLEQLSDMAIGRRIDLDTLESRDIYGTLSQVVAGYTLELRDRFDPRVTINTTPYAPYKAFALTDDDKARPDGVGSRSITSLTPTQTGAMTVVTSQQEYLWTTDPADFPLDIMMGGERITISGITGETSPQTFTISVRSVNGVVKSHGLNKDVHIAEQNRWALR